MIKGVQLVIVCEDILQETFIRAFLLQRGYHRRQLTTRKPDRGSGDAKQQVCAILCRELPAIRRYSGQGRGLIYVVDADNLSTAERQRYVEDACREAGMEPPRRGEAVFAVIPKWEIENWLEYLRAGQVDESSNQYEKYRGRESDVYPLAERLAERCDQQELPNAPASLNEACARYNVFKQWKDGVQDHG